MAFTPIVARDGNNAAQNMGALQDLAGINTAMVSLDSSRQVYRASATFLPLLASALALVTIKGSATKTVRITRIGLHCVGVAAPSFQYSLIRTSTIGTGGTIVAPTIGKLDALSAAATAVVQHYTTAAQSQGTAVASLSTGMCAGTLAAGTVNTISNSLGMTPVFPEFGAPIGQAIVLRGATDYVEIANILPATLITITTVGYFVEWTEDAS
jgi:hypothetical protein